MKTEYKKGEIVYSRFWAGKGEIIGQIPHSTLYSVAAPNNKAYSVYPNDLREEPLSIEEWLYEIHYRIEELSNKIDWLERVE